MNAQIEALIASKSRGIIGVQMALTVLASEVSLENFLLFCRKSLNGEALWNDFRSKQGAADDTTYDMLTYAESMLAKIRQQNAQFRECVEAMVTASSLLPPRTMQTAAEGRLEILAAIEFGFVTQYLGSIPTDGEVDAVTALVSIYDEFGKDNPSKDFIAECLEILKNLLT